LHVWLQKFPASPHSHPAWIPQAFRLFDPRVALGLDQVRDALLEGPGGARSLPDCDCDISLRPTLSFFEMAVKRGSVQNCQGSR